MTFGQLERKAVSMALVDRALRWKEIGEEFVGAPAQDEEFVLSHCDLSLIHISAPTRPY